MATFVGAETPYNKAQAEKERASASMGVLLADTLSGNDVMDYITSQHEQATLLSVIHVITKSYYLSAEHKVKLIADLTNEEDS